MKQKFTANILFLIGINILIKPFYSLAIDTSVQNIVGPESYGLFLAIFNFVYIQQVFADLGVQNYNNRDISRNPSKLNEVLPKILGSKVLFTLLFILLTIVSSLIFGYFEYFDELLIWVIGSQASLSMLLYLRTNISGTGRYFTDSFFSVLDKLILIIWMSYVIWGNPNVVDLTISYFAKVQFFSILTAVVFILIYTNKRVSKIRMVFDFSFVRTLLKSSLPYATLVILMAGYSRLDGIMLERLLNDNAFTAGEYARSFRLYDTLNNFTFLFAVLLLPIFSRMIKERQNVNELVIWAFKILTFGSIFGIIMIYFEGTEILAAFYRDATTEFPWTLLLLMCAGLSLSLNYIYGTLLTANGSIRILNFIAILGFMVNVILNFIVIPTHGKEGAALATLVTQTLVLILQIFYCYQKMELSSLMKPLLKLAIIGLFIFGCFYFMNEMTSIYFLINIIIVGILSLGFAFVIKLIKPSDFKMV